MILYADASAVMAWLFDEPVGESVRGLLERATVVVASQLTGLECHRAITRGVVLGRIHEADAAALRSRLSRGMARWTLFAITSDVVERAGLPFPEEPLRALDAIHLASALLGRRAQPDLELLSLDERVRRSAEALGFQVLPTSVE